MSKMTAPAQSPAWWLPELVDRHGPAETNPDVPQRWTWSDETLGVFIDQLSVAWQTVAWSPRRSVTLRTVKAPSDADMQRLIALAGLSESHRTAR